MPTTIPAASLLSGHLLHAALLAQLAYDHAGDADDKALSAELLKLGCELIRRIYEPSEDTHCFVCRDRTPGCECIRVVFRGTASFRNIRTDLDAVKTAWPWPCGDSWNPPVKCHKGMTDGYASVRDRVREACAPYFGVLDIETGGHSLGASEAVACAADLAPKYYRAKPQVRCVNFGCPHYGDAAFAAMYAYFVPYTLRVVHDLDCVPTVPLNLDEKRPEWVHVGQELRILDNGRVATRLGSWWRHFWSDLTGRAEGDHPVARYIDAIGRMP